VSKRSMELGLSLTSTVISLPFPDPPWATPDGPMLISDTARASDMVVDASVAKSSLSDLILNNLITLTTLH
jgi:hypothetical protein